MANKARGAAAMDEEGGEARAPLVTEGEGSVAREALPRFTPAHVMLTVGMLSIMLLGSGAVPMIDEVTLKPSEAFPKWLKTLSYYTNVPIKLGVLHAVFFGVELFCDPRLGERHIGQRLSTMWMQFFEHPRWGQHFHMQLETVLQVQDFLDRQRRGLAPRTLPFAARVLLPSIMLAMALTNFVTSCCYHTLREQLIGAVLALAKLLLVDYFAPLEHLNSRIGAAYTSPAALAAGVVLLVVVLLLATQVAQTGSSFASLLLHPTTLASSVFAGARGSAAARQRGLY